jgi:hypothetical protein
MEFRVVSQNIGGKETVARFSMTLFGTQVTNSLSLIANVL